MIPRILKACALVSALLLSHCGGESAKCGADGECNPKCAADIDCGPDGCKADGKCNPRCPAGSDPDCGETGCEPDGNCNPACPAGTDPDCAAAANKATWPGFNSAAGTMRGSQYQVTGALVPGEYGKTTSGAGKQVAPGVRSK